MQGDAREAAWHRAECASGPDGKQVDSGTGHTVVGSLPPEEVGAADRQDLPEGSVEEAIGPAGGGRWRWSPGSARRRRGRAHSFFFFEMQSSLVRAGKNDGFDPVFSFREEGKKTFWAT
jgi:hypothetical protein